MRGRRSAPIIDRQRRVPTSLSFGTADQCRWQIHSDQPSLLRLLRRQPGMQQAIRSVTPTPCRLVAGNGGQIWFTNRFTICGTKSRYTQRLLMFVKFGGGGSALPTGPSPVTLEETPAIWSASCSDTTTPKARTSSVAWRSVAVSIRDMAMEPSSPKSCPATAARSAAGTKLSMAALIAPTR